MRFYFISPIGATSPGLYETFNDTFVKEGHSIVSDIRVADIVFFDLHSGYLPYDLDLLRYVIDNGLPVVVFDAHDYHCNSTKHWYGGNDWSNLVPCMDNMWARFLYEAKDKCKPLIYFMRKMQVDGNFGNNAYPYELCLYPDHDFAATTMEELSSRPNDICFIGCKSPHREKVINGLLSDGRLKVDYQFTEERIPHNEWLNRHRQAKFFLEADGGGLGSERPYQLIKIAPMLRQRNLQKIAHDWRDGKTCLKISTTDGTVLKADIDAIVNTIKDPEKLYEIYTEGIAHMGLYFTPEARSLYILNIIKKYIP